MRYQPKTPTELKEIFLSENLPYFGICEAQKYPHLQAIYNTWLDKNQHGNMDYLERHAISKTTPDNLLTNCKSIIVVGLNYYQKTNPTKPTEGQIARYAWGKDYHKVLGKKLIRISKKLKQLYPEATFIARTDATPLMERQYALKAGLGFIGKNTMLISPTYGSWLLIGEIITDHIFPASDAATKKLGACGSCKRCQKACPTGALDQSYRINAEKCIAYLTIEHRGVIPENLRPKIGNRLFGCDICQEVCPHNIRAQATNEPQFLEAIAGSSQLLTTILNLKTEEEFRTKFQGSPLLRAKLTGLIRNACIVAANNNDKSCLKILKKLITDPDPIIAEHAKWAVEQMEKK